jgi:pyruvate/2-oxoglutarate dehydrogenase complex dihydrolipoamide acyltransferase (E2) component
MKTYKEISFPKTRIATFDVFEAGLKQHHIKGLLELDVTEARRLIKEYRNAIKKSLSFTAWLIKTISRTLEDFQSAHAYLKGKRKLILFDDIDISITVEREYDGKLVPLPYVIRQTNIKSFVEITGEIDAAKNQPLSKEDIVLGSKRNKFSDSLYYMMPGFIRRFFWRFVLGHPKLAKQLMGSVMVTSVGMMGKVNGWFIYSSVHPLSFGVGSIIKKPVVVKDRIEIREMLNMTVLINHDVIDGADMARFISRLTENIESGMDLKI